MPSTHPAAYLHEGHNPADTAARRRAAATRATHLGWPPPTLYLDYNTDLAVGHAPPLPTPAHPLQTRHPHPPPIRTRAAAATPAPPHRPAPALRPPRHHHHHPDTTRRITTHPA